MHDPRLALPLLIGLTLVPWVAASAEPRPNILMIVVDDLRPMLGCYGDERIKTPNIDRLARGGLVFDNAYCQYAKCGTSRLSFMTGLRPDSIGVFSNNERDVKAFRRRRPDVSSLASWFKQLGYHTQSFGKIYHDGWDNPDDWSHPSAPGRPREMWEVVNEEEPDGPTLIADRFSCPAMQRFDLPDDHLFAGRMTGQVIDELRKTDQQQPRLLAVGYRRPHLPFVAPEKYYDLYDPDESWLTKTPLPPQDSPVMSWFNSDGYTGAARRDGIEMPKRPNRQQAIDLNGYELRSYLGVPSKGSMSSRLRVDLLHAYAACVSYVDAQIGRLLDELDRSSLSDRTIVILFSDHGWHLGEHSAWGKMTNFEIATRVPLIISAPGFEPGRTKTIAELVDVFPTLCELAGAESPSHLQGESLVSVLRSPDSATETFATSQYCRYAGKYMGRAIRTNRFRYVAWSNTENDKIVQRELYDHRHDPAETSNLADDAEYNHLQRDLERKLLAAFD